MDINHLKSLLSPKIESLGYSVYDVELVNEDKMLILRVAIDHANGITVNDCEIVSNGISDYLDELDPITEEYYLQVCSPGAEREIRNENEFERFKGYFVHVETFEQTLEGTLFENYKDSILLQIRGKNITINKIDIQKIRLAIKF